VATAAVAARERGRGKSAYGTWQIDRLDRSLRHRTPRIGLWLDTTAQTPAQTVAEIPHQGKDRGGGPVRSR
jgi:hypothetical protein